MSRKRFKVFLDSNVIVSGLFSDKGSPRVILDILSLDLPMLSASTGEYNIIEIKRNLSKKMPNVIQVYKKYLKTLNLEIITLPEHKDIKNLLGLIADKDAPVLASAINGNVDFLVTGDKKDFSKLKGNYSFKILSPSEFLDIILPEILKALGND